MLADLQNDLSAPPRSIPPSAQWFLDVLQNCLDGAWLCEAPNQMDKFYVSSRLKHHLGYADEAKVGETRDWWIENIHPDDLSHTLAFRDELLKTRKTRGEIEFKLKHHLGHYIFVLMTCQVEKDPITNRVTRAAGTFTDVSPYRMLQTQLERTIEEAEAISQGKSKFIASLNHELRTPLSGILGMISLLREKPATPEQLHFYDNIEQSAEMMMALVNDILDVSKIAAGKLELEQTPFKIQEVIRHTIDLIQPAADKKNLAVKVMTDATLPSSVIGDRTRFQQILINLLNNAVKFTNQGMIRLNVMVQEIRDNTYVLFFEVIDTGIGISPENLDKLFQDFTQANASITRTHGGTGLGLSICKKLIHLMNGDINVSSTLGKGTTFSFHIPFACNTHIVGNTSTALPPSDTPEAPLHSATPSNPPHNSRRKLSILLVEDNKINQEVMLGLIERLGDNMEVANNGQEAVDLFAQKDYDLILMDINMPVMDGLTATKVIRNTPKGKDIPIVAVTANTVIADRENCMSNGMTDVMNKPVNRGLLETMLDFYRTPEEPLPSSTSSSTPSSPVEATFSSPQSALCAQEAISVTRTPATQISYEVLDVSGLITLAEDLGSETIIRLLSLYQKDAGQFMEELSKATDLKVIHDIGHTMAGMSENLSITELGKTARALMILCGKEPSKVPGVIHYMQKQFALALTEIAHFTKTKLMNG